jgi:hypothetical protein
MMDHALLGLVIWFASSFVTGPIVGKCLSGYRSIPRIEPGRLAAAA